MSSPGSVTYWLERLKAGDHLAAQKLWESYFQQLVVYARRKLSAAPRRVADEEDVALSAFHSFCAGAEEGRFPKLDDREDLWQVLLVITARKAFDLAEYEGRQKRGGGTPDGVGRAVEALSLEQIIGREPTPELAAQVAEEYQRLLGGLDDPSLRQVAQLKMEGYTCPQIARRLGCVPRTVERKLRLIRQLWSEEIGG